MKRLFFAAALAGVLCVTQLNASTPMRIEDIKEIHGALAGKEFKQPGDMAEKWMMLKSQMLELGAKEMREAAEGFSNRSVAAKWNAVASTKEELAKQLRGLPVPPEFTKKTTHAHDWMRLKAQKKIAKAEQMRIIARQLEDKAASAKMLKMADEKENLGKSIQKLAEKASKTAGMDVKEDLARG